MSLARTMFPSCNHSLHKLSVREQLASIYLYLELQAGRTQQLEGVWNGLQEMHNEIQEVLGQSFAVPDGLDEDDLLEELDALEDEMAGELDSGSRAGVPSYLQVQI